MIKKTFIEKYPEFKGKQIESYEPVDILKEDGKWHNINQYYEKDIEKLLDKHFIRKESYEIIAKDFANVLNRLNKDYIPKQKVKDALKDLVKDLKKEDYCVQPIFIELLKELGLE